MRHRGPSSPCSTLSGPPSADTGSVGELLCVRASGVGVPFRYRSCSHRWLSVEAIEVRVPVVLGRGVFRRGTQQRGRGCR